MPDPSSTPTPTLFKQWRSGDAASGHAMAQRFSDWYYAITTCRLGDAHGRGPLQRACVRFQQGILSVTSSNELTDWAHGLVMEEVRMAGGRIAGGDFPSQLTSGRSPSELLGQVAHRIDPKQVAVLTAAYDSTVQIADVQRQSEEMGGYPLAVLQARLAIKRALRDHAAIGFTEVPDAPNLDLAPLPLYEAGRMDREADEAGFEKWILSDMGLCKDIAEFGVFAQALRAGALRDVVKPAVAAAPAPTKGSAPRPAPLPASEIANVPTPQPKPQGGGMGSAAVPLALAALAGLLGFALLVGAVAYYFAS